MRVLCVYGFQIRGLHRLSIETLGDNDAMIRVAQKAGFVLEGVLRRAAWIEGGFVDEVVFGLLADEWAGTWTAGSLPGRPAVAPGGREDASGNRLAEPGGLDDVVDEAGRESFPASDAPAF